MTGFLIKAVMCPLTIILAGYLFPNVNFVHLGQPIILGLVLAIAGSLMELVILKRGTLWLSNVVDFVASTLLVYFVAKLFVGVYVTFLGAVLTAALLAVVEHLLHKYLIRTGKTKKSPA